MKALFPLFLSILLISGCTTTQQLPQNEQPEPEPIPAENPETRLSQHPTTQATLWVQNSAEYKALAKQAYSSATRMLPLPLQDSFWTASLEQEKTKFSSLPPAIILDVDETVLDNSPFQARMIMQQSGYNHEAWNEWCREANADAIPGAVEFTQLASRNGVAIFFITNRDYEVEEATRRNLIEVGFPIPEDTDNILSNGEQENWTSSKTERRKAIEEEYRVIMIFGDDLNDFLPAKNKTIAERDQIIGEHTRYFGRRWFMLPNPVYGSWDQAIYNFERDLDESEKEQILLKHLNRKEE